MISSLKMHLEKTQLIVNAERMEAGYRHFWGCSIEWLPSSSEMVPLGLPLKAR